jgi:benzoate 4-monooxygenase
MGELALGNDFGVLEAGKPASYSKLVELSQRFGNLSGVLPFGKYSKSILSWVPLPYVQHLWNASIEYQEYARHALEKRFYNDGQLLPQTRKQRQDIMQRFKEVVDPETGRQMDFDELRAETSSLM